MRKFIYLIIVITIVLAVLIFNTKKSIKVAPPANNKIYFSAFPDLGGEEDIVTKERIQKFEKLSQKKIVWIPFSQHWFKGLEYPKKSIDTIYKMGAIPYVRFLPRSTLKEHQKEITYSLDNINNGKFDIQLKAWAKEAKADNIPIIMDFALEMNGDWFGWSGLLNGGEASDAPKKYRKAYRHIIDLFRKEGANNITWFFHPTIRTEPNEEWNKPKNYYPGDDYIDWIGISIYGAFHPAENYWDSFDEILEENYKDILEISTKKPFAILELGVTDHHPLGEKPKWLKDAFKTILSHKYIKFKAIIYWHENWDNDGVLTSLRIDSSAETLSTFRELVKNRKFTSTVTLDKSI